MTSPEGSRPAAPPPRPGAPAAVSPAEEAARRQIVVGVLAVMVLGALDQAIVATALPTIGDLLGDFELLPWVVTAYMVASTVSSPLYGKLADIHGRRPLLFLAMGTFVLGSVLCALSPSIPVLIAGRALQGLGGGGIMSIPMTIIADVIPPRDRGRFQAYFAVGFAAAMVAGPLLGGLFAAKLHWSLIFWINLPIVAVSYLVMRGPLARLPRHHRPHSLDIPGSALMVLAAVALLVALDWGGTRYGWSSAPVLGLMAVSALLWFGFAWRNMRAAEPLLPFDVLRDTVVMRASVASFFSMGGFLGLMVATPLYFEGLRGLTTTETSFAFLALTLGTVIGSSNAGRLIRRVRRFKLLAATGHGIGALALLALAVFNEHMPLFLYEILACAAGAGFGSAFPISTVAVQNAVPVHHLGIATATLGFVRQMGGAVGAALMGAIAFGSTTPEQRAHHVMPEGGADIFTFVFAASAVWALLATLFFYAMDDRPLRSTVGHGPSQKPEGGHG